MVPAPVPFPGENTSRPRWRCPSTGDIEYCGERDRSPEPARKRLRAKVGAALIEYRAGLTLRGPVVP